MNSIRSNLHFFPSLSRLLEKYSNKDVYGDESDEYKVGIYEQDELIAEGKGEKKSISFLSPDQTMVRVA